MTVEELIKELQQIEDKTLDIKNRWVERVEVHHQGSSGYELDGEVILVTSE